MFLADFSIATTAKLNQSEVQSSVIWEMSVLR